VSFKNTTLLFLFLTEVQHNKKMRMKYIEQVAQPVFKSLGYLLMSGIKDNRYRDMNLQVIERTLISTLIGLSIMYHLESDSGPLHRMNIEDISCEIAALFTRGIANLEKCKNG